MSAFCKYSAAIITILETVTSIQPVLVLSFKNAVHLELKLEIRKNNMKLMYVNIGSKICFMHSYCKHDENKKQDNATNKQEQQDKTRESEEKGISGIL